MNCAASMKRTPAAQAALDAEREQPEAPGTPSTRASAARPARAADARQARVVDPADARMRRAGTRRPRSALAQCALHAQRQRLDALQDLPRAHRRQRGAVDAQRLHARAHREAEVAEGLEELDAVIARRRLGHARELAVVPREAAALDHHAGRASCRGRRGTWSPSGRRCRRRSGSGCTGTATAPCCRRPAARRAHARRRRPRRCRARCRLGLPMLSAKTARVVGRIAAAKASGDVGVDEGGLDAELARG